MKTIVIGIGNSDDKLTQVEWADFVIEIKNCINAFCGTIHFFGGSATWGYFQNVTWIVECHEDFLKEFAKELSSIRSEFKQDSIAWIEGHTIFI